MQLELVRCLLNLPNANSEAFIKSQDGALYCTDRQMNKQYGSKEIPFLNVFNADTTLFYTAQEWITF